MRRKHWPQKSGLGLGLGVGGGGRTSWTDDFSGTLSPVYQTGNNTWSIAGGVLYNEPVDGVDVITNGTFSNDSDWNKTAVAWTIDTLDSDKAEKNPGTPGTITQQVFTLGKWYRTKLDLVRVAGGFYVYHGTTAITNNFSSTSETKKCVIRSTGTGYIVIGGDTNANGTVDNAISNLLETDELFLTVQFAKSDVAAQVKVTAASGFEGGVVVCLDNPANPANFIYGCVNSNTAKAYLYKCVAGTFTLLKEGAVVYGAAKLIKVTKVGTTVALYYDGSQVSTDATVSDAGIISNKYHGAFSTGYGASECSLDDLSIT